MIAARLSKRVKALRLSGLDAYFDLLGSTRGSDELPNLLSALTTNVSHFFREEHHFEILRKQIIPELKSKIKSGDRVRIWSAGSSNGQELYSIAMTLLEEFPDFHKSDFKLLGTDIDPAVVSTANQGHYLNNQLKGLSDTRLKRFFVTDGDGKGATVSSELRSCVNFKILNLIRDWPMRHPFDVIFCRNVVIYFDEATQNRLWSRFESIMKPGAWLFLGHSERVQDMSKRNLRTAGITAYRRAPIDVSAKTVKEQDGIQWH